MNCLPVIEMEMRSASRRPWTFRLRLLFFLAGALTCLVVLLLPNFSAATKSRTMLVLLSFLGLAYCLGVGGLLTADSVSSEKRGGTLGLLLLTPLTGLDIVLGKLVCHGLQIFYGVCAVVPVFFLPLLLGGTTGAEVTRILLALTVALLLAPAIGLFISVLGTESRRTMMSTFTSVLLITVLPIFYFLIRMILSRSPAGGLAQLSPVFTILAGFDSNYRLSGGPARYWGSVVFLSGLSAIFIILAGIYVGRVFASSRIPSSRERCEPVRRSTTRVGDQNPYEWLLSRRSSQKRSLRLVTYLFVIFFVGMLMASLTSRFFVQGFVSAFFTALAMHLVAKLCFTVEATWQINADRHSGALELVLASPLPESSLLEAHLGALQAIARKQLGLVLGLNAVLLVWIVVFSGPLHMNSEAGRMFAMIFIGGAILAPADFCALRWVCILRGLKAATHPRAVLLSFSSVMVPPWIGMGLLVGFVSSAQPRSPTLPELMFLVWIALSLFYDWRIVQQARSELVGNLRHLASGGA